MTRAFPEPLRRVVFLFPVRFWLPLLLVTAADMDVEGDAETICA